MTTLPSGLDLAGRRERQLDELRQAHARAFDIDLRSAEHLDRVVLVGGAAAILASASHLHGLEAAPHPASLVLIGIGWGFLLLGGGCGLAAYLTAREAARCLTRMYANKIKAGNPILDDCDFDSARPFNESTRKLNYAGLFCFAVGVLNVLAFAWLNLPMG